MIRGRTYTGVVAAAIASACLGLVLGGPWGCRQEPPEANLVWQSTCEADSVGIGDPIGLTIEGRWPASAGPLHLGWSAAADTLLLVARDSAATAAPEGWEGRHYQLTVLAPRSGQLAIPPAALVSAESETLALTAGHIVSVGGRIATPDQAELRPLAPLASLRGFPYLKAALGALILAILVAAWFFWHRRRAELIGPPAPPPIPPDVEFRGGLDELLGRRLREEGHMRAFTQELSWILRRYLGRRWEQPALEATRPEILRWLPRTEMSVGDQQEVAGWLEQTDRIKFAGAVPLLTETDLLIDRARQVVSRGEKLAAERLRREDEARQAAEAGEERP